MLFYVVYPLWRWYFEYKRERSCSLMRSLHGPWWAVWLEDSSNLISFGPGNTFSHAHQYSPAAFLSELRRKFPNKF